VPSERIAVTGAAGRLGRAVVEDLRAHDYAVLGVDRVLVDLDGSDFAGWDGRDVDGLAAAIDGCSALIHLAAIAAPYRHPHQEVFGNNTTATFAALQAAADTGVRRAVIASSGSAYGTAFSPRPTHPRYVPVDEDHPMENADPYGLSKEVDERTAAMFTRRYEMCVAALRFHWIVPREEQLAAIEEQRRGEADAVELLRGLWGYVDLRDAARACRLAIESAARSPYGFAALQIAAADVLSERPLLELIGQYAPDIDIRAALTATQSGYSTERAARLIGWRAQHSWRDPGQPPS
jgi:nucleoside-diphosphate-sugar epimerase